MITRAPLSLFLIVILVSACGEAATNAQGSQTPGTSPAAPNAATPRDGGVTLEFDLPDEFRASPAGVPDAVTGFRVGYFRASDSAAIRTVDFSADALTVQGRTARVTLPREAVPGCAADCAIRVQTLSGGQVSAWSDPVPLGTRAAAPSSPKPRPAEPPRATRTERPRNASPQQRRQGLVPADIEPYAALIQELRALLPPDAGIEEEVRRFRRVADLALAVAISREYDVPFATLSRAIEGPPRLNPRNALIKLRPDLEARAVRKVRAEARRLVERANGLGQ